MMNLEEMKAQYVIGSVLVKGTHSYVITGYIETMAEPNLKVNIINTSAWTTIPVSLLPEYEVSNSVEDILKHVNSNIKAGRYPQLTKADSIIIRQHYASIVPEGLPLDGSTIPLYTIKGTLISNGYDRVVIGDYGAYIEFNNTQGIKASIKIKKGEEYRLTEKYRDNVKYFWYTAKDESNIKIYYQRKEVSYADYKVGKLYVAPSEVLTTKHEVKAPISNTKTVIEKSDLKIEVMMMNVDLKKGKYETVGFSGHRPEKIGGYNRLNPTRVMISTKIEDICKYLIANCRTTNFVTGGALGIDQDAADVVIKMREQYIETTKDLNMSEEDRIDFMPMLHVVVPFAGQESHWTDENQKYYREQCANADKTTILYEDKPESYKNICIALNERNEAMVDDSDLMVITWDGTVGGTKNCLDYAKKENKPIILLKLTKIGHDSQV